MDYVPLYALYISILSIGVSVITFVVTFIKQQRSQQFRIAIDVNDKLKETVNKFAEFGIQPHHDIEIKTAKIASIGRLVNPKISLFQLFL